MGRQHEKQRTVVVDLGRGSIKLAVAESRLDAVHFHGITEIRIPSLNANDAVDQDSLAAELLKAEVARHGWSGMQAACILSGAATSTQSIMLPPMPEADKRRAIELKLRDTLHFELSEATYDFTSTGAEEAADSEPDLTLVAVARTEVIDRSLDLVRAAGLTPVAVSTAAESLSNLSQCTSLWDHDEASIYIDVGSHSAILNLFEGKRLRLSREIDIGRDDFTKALTQPIAAGNETLQLSYAQAEELVALAGYPLEARDQPVMHGVTTRDMQTLMEPIAHRIAAELERSIDYLCSLLGRDRVDGIVLSGSGGNMLHFDHFLRSTLSTPVVYSDPVERAMVHWRLAVTDARPEDLAGFSAILGYSLGKRASINLLPADAIQENAYGVVTRLRKAAVPAVAAVGICLALAGIPITRSYGGAADLLQWSTEQIDAQLDRQERVTGERKATIDRLTALDAERGDLPNWTGLMKELSTILPDGCWITALDSERTAAGHFVYLRASVLTNPTPFHEMNAKVTNALAASPFFKDVHVVQAASNNEKSTGTYEATFVIESLSASSEATGS